MTRSNDAPPHDQSVRVKEAIVVKVLASYPDVTKALVRMGEGEKHEALSYHALTGPLHVGDRVLLNTTASRLKLGTGGVHFVMAVPDRLSPWKSKGHIMKLRYTPIQMNVLSVEEEDSPHHDVLKTIPDLQSIPVIVGTLHSQVPIIAAFLKAAHPQARIAYVMTDGGALPASFSRLIRTLKKEKIVDVVFTAGHAFGGDYETVTVPSALSAAYVVAEADVVIVCMGPGVVGTGTPLGTTALEQGPLLDAAASLGATPVPVVRASGADERPRHRGISHHTLTVLTRFTFQSTSVPLSIGPDEELTELIRRQSGALTKKGHTVRWFDGRRAYEQAERYLLANGIQVTTMGRSAGEDPLYFWTTAAAAAYAGDIIDQRYEKTHD